MGLGQFGVLEFLLDYLNLNKKSKLGKVEMVMVSRMSSIYGVFLF